MTHATSAIRVDRYQAPLEQALREALETLAFISPLPVKDGWRPPSDVLLVTICFNGRSAGELVLAAPRAFAETLSANILAAVPGDLEAPGGAGDALKELANIVCGAVIYQTAGSERDSVEMGLPECRPVRETEWNHFVVQPGTLLFDADGHVIAARFLSEGS